MTVNKENVDTVIRMMKTDNRLRFNMATWINTEASGGWCGTACCIAGFASVAVNGPQRALDLDDEAYTIGQEFFGLSDRQAKVLFIPSFKMLNEITQEQAIQVLEHLRDTGEVRWTVAGYDKMYDEDFEGARVQ